MAKQTNILETKGTEYRFRGDSKPSKTSIFLSRKGKSVRSSGPMEPARPHFSTCWPEGCSRRGVKSGSGTETGPAGPSTGSAGRALPNPTRSPVFSRRSVCSKTCASPPRCGVTHYNFWQRYQKLDRVNDKATHILKRVGLWEKRDFIAENLPYGDAAVSGNRHHPGHRSGHPAAGTNLRPA